MAFGIDDVLAMLAGGIRITETVVETIDRYKKNKEDYDVQQLLSEVKITTVKRIKEADLALTQFERTLTEKQINIDMPISDVIRATPFWHPYEQFRLSQVRKRFDEFSDSVYAAEGDIAALVRCGGRSEEMGAAVVNSMKVKHEMHFRLMNAKSLKEAIGILREQLARHEKALS